ncbi:uncharacterized protein BO97DRAFT_462592 [Aspergillus homomorphus CBS 101889]|uniref:Uncharacterized protein n=1 Tax=Aspergillus homomorphus (strain CBS 101889) TaxID=1450537 RepID=A0A395HJM7_ASPHC|nr:hypothetical protein BO97DRAFT_462592 [Aspergillus homomorphus CBS 101889]RAL07826.1 hypothetical protein BO97DRAFT_462592 [Aspergillus homomorphus CBS 101889]
MAHIPIPGVWVGATVRLERSEWTIMETINHCEFPCSRAEAARLETRPFTCARFRVRRTDNDTKAFMRVYRQIPIAGTENDSPAQRARQAISDDHVEPAALEKSTNRRLKCTPALLDRKLDRQDQSGYVPGEYHTTIVWSTLPGIRLGDVFGPDTFWSMPREERDLIRAEFRTNIMFVSDVLNHDLPYHFVD